MNRLKDNSKFKSWILTATKNESLNFNKYIARHKEVSLSEIENRIEDSSIRKFDSKLNFEQMIDGLSDEEKKLVRMKFEENYKNFEIAKELGIPYNTLKSKINRAIRKITLIILILIMISGFIVLATFVTKQIKSLFTTSLNAINTAVENNYVQEIDSDFVYSNGIGIKVDAIILDDKNLDISFVYDVKDKDKYGKITGIGLYDYVIKSGDEVLFDTERKEETVIEVYKQNTNNFNKFDEYYRNSILYSNFNDFKDFENISISIKSIIINNNKLNRIISGNWKFDYNIIEKLNERSNYSYFMEYNPNVKQYNVSLIDTSINFEIEFSKKIEENAIYYTTLYDNNKNAFIFTDFIFDYDKNVLKISIDLGKYKCNIDELFLQIKMKNYKNIMLKFRRVM